MNENFLAAHELILSVKPDLDLFKERASAGSDGYWGTCIDNSPDFKRFRGVLLPEYVRVSVDLGFDGNKGYAYVVCPWRQSLNQEQAALRILKILGGGKVFWNGIEVPV